MKLTAIKIPGKRWASEDANGARKNDKKRKHQVSLADQKAIVKRMKTKKVQKPLSQTSFSFRKNGKQHIPIDILEMIFLYSENTNFPRASHHLGFLLSGELTLINTIHAAFGPTWESYWRHLHDTGTCLPDSAEHGNPHFQTSVLAAPWAKFGILQKAFKLWSRKMAIPDHTLCFQHGISSEQHITDPVLSNIADDNCIAASAHECCQPDSRALVCDGSSPPPEDIQLLPLCCLIHPKTKVPDLLISGPWETWEKIQRLFWLVRMGACLQEQEHWELSLEGYHRLNHVKNFLAETTLRLIFVRFALWRHWPHSLLRIDSWQRDTGEPPPDMPFPVQNMLEDNGPNGKCPFA